MDIQMHLEFWWQISGCKNRSYTVHNCCERIAVLLLLIDVFRLSQWLLVLLRRWFDCRRLMPSVACLRQLTLKMLRRLSNLSSLLTSRRSDASTTKKLSCIYEKYFALLDHRYMVTSVNRKTVKLWIRFISIWLLFFLVSVFIADYTRKIVNCYC